MSTLKRVAALALALAVTTTAGAGVPPVQPAGIIGEPGGSGPYPAIAVSDESMPENTLYYPAAWPDGALPLLVWGTGGCRDDGLGYSMFLREVASYGYFVISGGHPRVERKYRDLGMQLTPEEVEALRELPDTSVDQLLGAIDWAEAQTVDSASPYYGHIDTDLIAAMGHSCGGLQAIALGTDPRVDTVIAFNSGVLSKIPEGFDENANLVVEKSALDDLHGPIAYINGGPEDIAYENAVDDMQRLDRIPVFFGDNGVGHGGTFWADDAGGEYSDVAINWMDWQLKGDADAGAWFVGDECTLCADEDWSVSKKSIDD